MFTTTFSTFLFGVIGVSVVHALMPQHWLPFVLVGRKSRWSDKKVAGYLLAGALAHMASTVGVGLVTGYLGYALQERWENLHGILPGLVLIAFGAGYFMAHFHKHIEVSEILAGRTLVVTMALSPCVAVSPFFLIMGPMGLGATLVAAVIMALVNIALILVLGLVAQKGFKLVQLDWLEHNESKVVGSLMMTLGLLFILIH